MADSSPDPNNPLSPYYPSETPSISGNGRKWAAILLLLIFLLSASLTVLSFLFSL